MTTRKKHSSNVASGVSSRARWKSLLNPWASVALICFAGVLAYSNVSHASFHFDDETSVINNPAIRNLNDLRGIFFYSPSRFVTFLTFAVNFSLGGLDVAGYHLGNLAVHLLTGIAAWALCRQMLRNPYFKGREVPRDPAIMALFVGLLVVLHPIQTQAVTYVAQRASVLAAFFFLGSLYSYGEGRLRQKEQGSGLAVTAWFGASGIAFALGALSKESALTLPFAIALYEITFLREGRRFPWRLIVALTTVAVLVPVVLLTSGLVASDVAGAPSGWRYLVTQPAVVLLYIRLLVLPVGQNLDHDIPVANSLFEPMTLLGLAVIALLLFAAAKLFENHRVVAFGIIWFFLTLLPESSILPLPDVMFEHRLYLPMIGFSLAVTFGLLRLTRTWKLRTVLTLAGLSLFVLGAASFERNKVWKNDVSLWTDVTAKSPRKSRGYLNLGRAYADLGLLNLALDHFQRAQRLDPTNADIYGNRANVFVRQGQLDAAIAESNHALALGGGLNYQAARIYYSRGTAYLLKNRLDSAYADLSEALRLDANHESAFFNRALVSERKGDMQAALSDYSECLTRNPLNAKALNNRGVLHKDAGRLTEAMADFEKSVVVQPDFPSPYLNRGMVWSLRGQLDQAVRDFSSFITLQPNNVDGYFHRAGVYVRMQEFEKAKSDFGQACRLNPTFGPAFLERARVLLVLKQYPLALADMRRAQSLGVRVDPILLSQAAVKEK